MFPVVITRACTPHFAAKPNQSPSHQSTTLSHLTRHAPPPAPLASAPQLLVYLNGSLKNVSNDTANQRALAKAGALPALATLLTQLSAQVWCGAVAKGHSMAAVGVPVLLP